MANTANIQILRSYSNTVPSTLLDGQLAYSFVSNTLYIGSNTYGVLSVTDQQTANIARSAQSNTVYTQGVDVTQNTNITYATSLAQSAFNAANNVAPQVQPAFNTANAAFLQANSAASNTVYTQGVDNTQNTNIGILTNNLGSNVLYFQGIENTQNTNITAVNTFAQSGYNQANTATTNSVYLQGGLNTANANIAYILGVDLTQNTNIGSVINNLSSNVNYFQGIENTQNTNITAVNTYATSAYNQANATNTYATSAYGQANATNSLAQSGYNQANATNTYASSAYNQANATNTYATSAYGQANSANNLAQSSFNQANASNSLAQSGYNQANATNNYATSAYGQANATNNYATSAYNTANSAQSNTVYTQGVDVTQNTNIGLLQSAMASANANIVSLFAIDLTQNASLLAVNTFANSAYNQANATNTYAASAYGQANATNTYATSAYGQANAANSLAQSGYNQANSANSLASSSYAQANATNNYATSAYNQANATNTYATSAYGQANATNNYATSAYNQANATNTYATSAYAQANSAQANIVVIQGVDISQNNRMTVIEGVDLAQNTIIQNAYNTANVGNTFVKTGGTVGGSVIFTGDINVSGNIYLSGNSTLVASNTLSVNDSIIYLAANNNSNTLDLGIVGHFVGGSANKYQHTGVVRNHNNGTWTFFSNVSTEPSTVVNWAEANLVYDSIQTGGIISPTATINNIELGNYTQLAYNQANAISSYANSSITIMSGVNATQNSWISANQIYSQAAYAQANATNQYATSAYAQANVTNNYATSAYGQANAANSLAGSSYIQANAANSLAQSGYNQANAANNLASSAYAQANAANNLASSAYTQANATNNYATSAYNQANATNTYATSAYGQANAANSLAQSGYNQANAANNLAQSGYNQANSANSLASSSYAQANATNNYATSAYNQANATNTYATSAYAQANASNQYANVAFLTANNAVANLGPIITTNSAATVYVSNTTPSTSNTTGALIVNGGLGVGGNLYASTGTFTTITGQTEVLKGTGENLFNRSQAFSYWCGGGSANVTGTDNASTAPDGTTTATNIVPNTTNGLHRTYSPITASVSSGATYTMSVYAKANGYRYLFLNCGNTAGTAVFDVQAGTVTNGTATSATITAVSGATGWYRLVITGNATISTVPPLYWQIQSTYALGDQSFAGDGTSGILLWGAQLEFGTVANTYVPTTTTAIYGTPTLSFSGVAGLSLASNGSLYVSPAGTSSTNVTSNLTVMSATTSTSNTTGALVVSGGIGVAGPIYSTGGSLTINNGLATTGNSGTIFLGDGSFTKTSGSLFTFSAGVSTTTLYGTTQVQAGAGTTTNPSYGLVGTSGIGMYFPTTGSIGFLANTANALFITAPTSSVNFLQVSGNTSNSGPVLSSQGANTNIDINITPKGTGNVNIYAANTFFSGNIYASNILNSNGISFFANTTGIILAVDRFTANGTGNTFTLSQTPQNINYTSVNLNGVTQLKTAYTLTGNIITLSSPPYANAVIEVTSYQNSGNGIFLQNLGSTYTTNNQTTFSNTTPSTSNTTGSVVISGGLGVGGDVYASNGVFNGIITGQTEVLKGTGTNLFTQSQTFTVSPWGTTTGTTLSTGQSDPIGGSTATKIQETATTTFFGLTVNPLSSGVSVGMQYTFSLYVKAAERTQFYFQNGNIFVYINLSNGTIVSSTGSNLYSTNITNAGNGWYRCSVTITGISGINPLYLDFGPAVGGTNTYAGTVGYGIYIWGAQLEIGSVTNTYIPTTTTAIYGTPTLSFSGVAGLGLQSDGSLYVSPAGTGALQAQATTSTATGGNARGPNAVDWQTVRSTASQVAGGTLCFLGGGTYNTSTGYAAVVSGGSGNISNGGYGIISGGLQNSASGQYAISVGGFLNSSKGYYNFIGGGFTNAGTAQVAVTTQAAAANGVTSGNTSVTLAGSNSAIKVGQLVSGTGIVSYPNDTYVTAISGTSLTLSQNASANGTPTLSFYTPHGVVVGGGNNSANGAYSFVGGGGDAGTAANGNLASGDWSTVTGGQGNKATGNYSFIGGGYGNLASGYGSFIGTSAAAGNFNTASGTGAAVVSGVSNGSTNTATFIGGGYGNMSNSYCSGILAGWNSTTRSIAGAYAHSAGGFAAQGDAQSGTYMLLATTTTSSTTQLTAGLFSPATNSLVTLPNNWAYNYVAYVVGRNTSTGDAASWKLEGLITRGSSAASTTLVGSPTVTLLGATSGAISQGWGTVGNCTATADTTNGALSINGIGVAATTIHWVARVQTVEVA